MLQFYHEDSTSVTPIAVTSTASGNHRHPLWVGHEVIMLPDIELSFVDSRIVQVDRVRGKRLARANNHKKLARMPALQ
jgi:hypothetical protein